MHLDWKALMNFIQLEKQMNKKIDIIIKLVISAAIIVTLAFLALPVLQKQGIIKTSAPAAGGYQSAGGPPQSGGAPSGAPSGGKPGGSAQSGGRPAAAGVNAQAVKAYTASISTVSKYIKVNGDVLTDVEIDIYPDVSGKITNLNTYVGDYVTKDEIIASVDPSLPGQQFSISPVYSTISGTVLSINERIGDKVTSNTSIITIGDLRNLKLVTYIPEKFTGNLKTGLPAEVFFAAFPTESFNAKISEISPVIDPTSRTMEVTLQISDRTNKIKTGMFASIKLATEQAIGVVAIPAAAVFQYYGRDTVFVIKADNTVEHREISIGLESAEMVEVTGGLSAGETVVTEGQSILNEGSAVKIVK